MKRFTIDTLSLALIALALLISFFVGVDMVRLQIMLTFGLVGTIVNMLYLNGRVIFSNDLREKGIPLLIAIGVFGSLLIQFLFQIPSQFFVSAWEVYAFYAIAAIAEECFFRYFIGTLLMIALQRFKETTRLFISVPIMAIGFMLAHLGVYQAWEQLFIVFFTGMLYSYLYIQSKSMLPSLISHVVINIIASSFIVQTLAFVVYPVGQEITLNLFYFFLIVCVLSIILIVFQLLKAVKNEDGVYSKW